MGQELHIDLDKVKEIALLGVRRAMMFMGFGVNAAEDPASKDYQFRGFFQIRLLPDDLPAEIVTEAKRNFRQWVIGNGLTELLHNYSLFLDEVYAVGLLFINKGHPAPEAEFRSRVNEFRSKTSIASKLRLIRIALGFESIFAKNFHGFTKARNALIHANGVILREHCDDGKDELNLAWPGFRLIGKRADGQEFEIVPELVVEATTTLIFRVTDRKRTFRLGETIAFEPSDVAEICMMVQRDVDALAGGLIELARSSGIPLTGPGATHVAGESSVPAD